MLSSMVKANCLVIIGEVDERIEAGETVYVHPFADLL